MFCGDQSYNQERLLSMIQQRKKALEEALTEVIETKKQLHQSALEAKSQIHTSVSRQLETLRNREVWLLNQVEVIQKAKEDVLGKQEQQLNQALGTLQSSLEFSSEDGLVMKTIDEKKLEMIRRFDELELCPEVSPDVSYQADISKMREAIHGFGKIEAKNFSVDCAFADPETSSTSLPRAFEDYDDEDHHVLYKTVAEINSERNQNTSIHVQVPKLKKQPDEWLMMSPENLTSPSPSIGSKFTFPPFARSAQDFLPRKEKHQSPSIQQWLRDIKQDTATEDEEFEVISSSRSSSAYFFPQQGSQIDMKQDELPYFKRISVSNTQDWLLTGDRIRAEFEFGTDYPYDAMQYFKQVSSNAKDWLLNYEENKKMESVEASCTKNSCCQLKKKNSIDIENLDELVCMKNTEFSHHLSEDISAWLQNDHPAKKSMDTEEDEKDVDMADTEGKCRANEPCRTFDECVCDVNCCMTKSTKTPDQGKWLLHPESVSYSEAVTFQPFDHNEATENHDWLLNAECRVVLDDGVTFPVFENASKTSPKDWLRGNTGEGMTENMSAIFTNSSDSYTVWLKTSGTEILPNCCKLEYFDTMSKLPASEWVKKPTSSEPSCPEVCFAYFTEVCNDPKMWLKSCHGINGNADSNDYEVVFPHFKKVALKSEGWVNEKNEAESCLLPVDNKEWLLKSCRENKLDGEKLPYFVHEKFENCQDWLLVDSKFEKSEAHPECKNENKEMSQMYSHAMWLHKKCDTDYSSVKEDCEKNESDGKVNEEKGIDNRDLEDSIWLLKCDKNIGDKGQNVDMFKSAPLNGENLKEWLLNVTF